MQLDLFEDSRDVLLNNAVVAAFAAHDADATALAIAALHDEFPSHRDLASHKQLLEQLKDFRRNLQPGSLQTRVFCPGAALPMAAWPAGGGPRQ